jgi:hypothetical protein
MVTPMEWFITSRTDQPGHGDSSGSWPDQPTGPDLDAQRGEERFRGRVET